MWGGLENSENCDLRLTARFSLCRYLPATNSNSSSIEQRQLIRVRLFWAHAADLLADFRQPSLVWPPFPLAKRIGVPQCFAQGPRVLEPHFAHDAGHNWPCLVPPTHDHSWLYRGKNLITRN